MLELIGLIALIYVTIKYFPDILQFAFKVVIVLIGLYLALAFFGFVLNWIGFPIVVMVDV